MNPERRLDGSLSAQTTSSYWGNSIKSNLVYFIGNLECKVLYF